MTAVLPAPPPLLAVRPLAESRPPYLTWPAAAAAVPGGSAVPGRAAVAGTTARSDAGPARRAGDPAPGRPGGPGRVVVSRSGWTAVPDPDLPDAAAWSRSLAVAVVEALLARRPVAQLNRWLSEEVLAGVTLHARRRRARPGTAAVPTLVLARVQHPAPRVAEVCALLRVGPRPLVLALRLEALGERWLCTALELGPRHGDEGPGDERPGDERPGDGRPGDGRPGPAVTPAAG